MVIVLFRNRLLGIRRCVVTLLVARLLTVVPLLRFTVWHRRKSRRQVFRVGRLAAFLFVTFRLRVLGRLLACRSGLVKVSRMTLGVRLIIIVGCGLRISRLSTRFSVAHIVTVGLWLRNWAKRCRVRLMVKLIWPLAFIRLSATGNRPLTLILRHRLGPATIYKLKFWRRRLSIIRCPAKSRISLFRRLFVFEAPAG